MSPQIRHAGLGTTAIFVALTASPAHARQAAMQPDSQLVRIESLITMERRDEARTLLATWTATHTDAPGAHRATAGLLRGRLARSWPEAEEAYLSTVLRYPVTAQAPEALLRLGQGLVTAASTGREPDAARRAVAYLERLVADYPNYNARPAAYLWLARALHANGQTATACARLRQAPIVAADSTTASLIDAERRAHCDASTGKLPLVQAAPPQ